MDIHERLKRIRAKALELVEEIDLLSYESSSLDGPISDKKIQIDDEGIKNQLKDIAGID